MVSVSIRVAGRFVVRDRVRCKAEVRAGAGAEVRAEVRAGFGLHA